MGWGGILILPRGNKSRSEARGSEHKTIKPSPPQKIEGEGRVEEQELGHKRTRGKKKEEKLSNPLTHYWREKENRVARRGESRSARLTSTPCCSLFHNLYLKIASRKLYVIL